MIMSLVRTEFNKSWIPYKNKVDFYICDERAEFDAPVTTVHGFFFNANGEILLVRHHKRGWEVPGGHIEEGESFEAAMHRELFEETQKSCEEFHQLGYLKKEAMEAEPDNCHYPYPLSYCIFYSGMISKEAKFTGDEHIVEAKFFSIEKASVTPWIIAYKEYFQAAIENHLL